MSSLSVLLKSPPQPFTDEPNGQVLLAVGERTFLVTRGQRSQLCQQAFGCLVEPVPGDKVLLADVDATTFILCVLERSGDARPTLRLPEGLDIDTVGELRLRARELDCQATALTYTCAEVRGFVGIGKLVGRAFELVADKWLQISKQSFRISEQLDCVRAGELDCETQQSLRLHAKHTLISADQLSKLDACQIHIG